MLNGKIIDISRTLSAGAPVWPGDAPFRLERKMSLEGGDPVNLTTLHMSPHTGSHADAPGHVDRAGASIGALPLEPFIGPARVLTVAPGEDRLIATAAFASCDPADPPRILLRTGADGTQPSFKENFPALSPEAAVQLVADGARLVGIDTPGVDRFDSVDLPVHRHFARSGVCWLENLDLSGVVDGIYTLVALPLKIEGGDGSPVRAILIDI